MQKIVESAHCEQCGEYCTDIDLVEGGLHFCCNGCKTAYKLIHTFNNVHIDVPAALEVKEGKYAFLDDADMQDKLLSIKREGEYTFQFFIPAMHCASCVYVLEHLDKLDEGVLQGQVNFGRKTVTICYDNTKTSLRKVVELMDNVGYAPELNQSLTKNKKTYKVNRGLMLRIAVAGFCFGNIMMLSFPEYLAGNGFVSQELRSTFMWLSLVLSLPIVFYCADSYFIKSYQSIKARIFDIDLPIAISMAVTFLRGIYEVIFEHSAGYFDSLAGLVFFLLVGRWFQQKTYNFMAFERENEAYMPLSTTLLKDGMEHIIAVMKLKTEDLVRIKSREIIPADGVLTTDFAVLDYSFVTGESTPVYIKQGELIHAGCINAGKNFDITVLNTPDQSYLLTLWNAESHDKARLNADAYQWVNDVARLFTIITVAIAAAGAGFWMLHHQPQLAIKAFTSVLIVACPCVLALALPFTQGHVLRLLGRHGFYLKGAGVIERLRRTNAIVFDKTGTITDKTGYVEYSGEKMSSYEQGLVKTITYQSMHPLSRRLAALLSEIKVFDDITQFKEVSGKGISAMIDGHAVKVGSVAWTGIPEDKHKAGVHIAIDGHYKGYYHIEDARREGIGQMLTLLRRLYKMYLVTGDNETHQMDYQNYFDNNRLYFNAKPEDKMYLVDGLQTEGNKVLMIGDGLNDAAALKSADVGVAIFDKASTFIPACDAMLDASKLRYLPAFLKFARYSRVIVLSVFAFALIYNSVAVVYALEGKLVPLFAAILMPISSATIVILTTVSTYLMSKRLLRFKV